MIAEDERNRKMKQTGIAQEFHDLARDRRRGLLGG